MVHMLILLRKQIGHDTIFCFPVFSQNDCNTIELITHNGTSRRAKQFRELQQERNK